MGSSRVTATQADASQLKVDASGVAVPVTDNAGSLTVDGTVTAVSATAANLKVDASGVAVPVTDNAGSLTVDGTVTVTQATAANLKVDPSGVTSPVSAASLPLPTGAATSALQGGGLPAALGAGGGVKVDGSGTALPVSGTVTATGPLTDTQLRATAVPVSGTVTANAGSGPFPVSDNSGSLTVDAPVGTPVFVRLSDGSSAIATLPVSLASAPTTAVTAAALPLPAGASTSALQGGGLPAALGSGGGVKVDGSGTALPVSGTVTIGTSVTPGTAATNLGKAEDAGHTTGDVGVMSLAVRNDAGTPLAGTDLDYIPLTTDSSGALRTVGGTGGTQYTEDVASAGAEALTLAGTIRQDTPAGSTTTDGDYANLKTDSVGRLWVNPSGVTQPVSNASLPLPAGASTAAKQPALGTAGTASADVITMQGIAAGVPLFGGLRQINISQTPTVSTSPAYTIGDALGGLLTFANAARTSAGSGLLQAVTIMCKTPALIPVIDIYLFNQTFTATSDNAAFAPSDGDMANCIGVVTISNWAAETASSLNSIATRFGMAFPFTLTGTSLFGQMVTRTAITAGGTTDFVVGFQVIYSD